MAFDINTINGFGTGANGVSTGEFGEGFANSYAHVTAVGTNSITIDTATKMDGLFETFTEGTEILFHVSAAADSKSLEYLGRWTIATITAVNDNVLTLDTDISQIIPPDSFGEYFCQVVTVAHFTTLTLAEGTAIKPLPYNTTNNYGGILALKCSEMLTFDGGHIDLTAAGIPLASKALRPEFAQETEVGGHGATHAGWENFITRDRLLINCPDGASFIAAKTVKFNEKSRVGNPNDVGTLRKRAGSSYQHIQGGSTIFMAADEITDFTPKLISKKTSNTGTNARGFARCFIASNTPLPVDEGLYSFDRFTNPLTPMEIFNVRDFGNGSLGNATDITVQLNNYAKVTAISSDRQKLTYSGKTTGGLTQINRGALVMVHATHKSTTQGLDDTGKFIVATVLADDGTDITIDAPAPDVNVADSYVQIVSIPQFDNFTLTGTNSATPYFDGSVGGILALAVKNHCDLSGGGKIYVPGNSKSKVPPYVGAGLRQISNVNMCDRLPIGEGRGSVFLLTKTLTLGDDSRIGGLQSGAKFGGRLSDDKAGTYRGYEGSDYAGGTAVIVAGKGGGGSGGGEQVRDPKGNFIGGKGGFGSNGSSGYQGAHVLIIADTINNFKQANLSTGGARGTSAPYLKIPSSAVADFAGYGGAGYGGSGYGYGGNGGFNGGGGGGAVNGGYGSGGGSTGWAFIYCNNAVNQDTSATLYND